MTRLTLSFQRNRRPQPEEAHDVYRASWTCQQCGHTFQIQVGDSQESANALASLALEDHLESRHGARIEAAA